MGRWDTTLKDWMAKHATSDKTGSITAAMKATGRTRCRANVAYNKWAVGKGVTPPAPAAAVEQGKGKAFILTDRDIDEKHDPFYRINKAAKALKKGEYYEDSMFRDVACRMGVNEFRRPSLDPAFDSYRGKAGGMTYWGHPESIKTRKERGVFK